MSLDWLINIKEKTMVKRKSIIIYFRNPKALKHIEKIVPITYFTKKKKYAVCYINEDELSAKIKALKEIKLVRKIEESMFSNDEYQIEL